MPQVQLPPTQDAPEVQTVPHEPQLLESDEVSEQYGAPPSGSHSVWPGGHVAVPVVQKPPEQISDQVHACPHAPQLLVSLEVMAQ